MVAYINYHHWQDLLQLFCIFIQSVESIYDPPESYLFYGIFNIKNENNQK